MVTNSCVLHRGFCQVGFSAKWDRKEKECVIYEIRKSLILAPWHDGLGWVQPVLRVSMLLLWQHVANGAHLLQSAGRPLDEQQHYSE